MAKFQRLTIFMISEIGVMVASWIMALIARYLTIFTISVDRPKTLT